MGQRDLAKMRVYSGGFILLVALSGCSDAPFTPDAPDDIMPDRVIARMNDLEARPSWLEEGDPFIVDGDQVVSLGATEISADKRIDAAYRIAESNAQAAIAGAIEKRMEYIFQNAEEGTGFDSTQARYIGAEATRLLASSIRPKHHYWEKIAYTAQTGRRLAKYRVFASMEMPADDFKRAILEAARRASGKGQLSADFAQKVNEQWNRITEFNQPTDSQSDHNTPPLSLDAAPQSADSAALEKMIAE